MANLPNAQIYAKPSDTEDGWELIDLPFSLPPGVSMDFCCVKASQPTTRLFIPNHSVRVGGAYLRAGDDFIVAGAS